MTRSTKFIYTFDEANNWLGYDLSNDSFDTCDFISLIKEDSAEALTVSINFKDKVMAITAEYDETI